jgi:DNA polymerase III epsilon subunit-like protein
LKSVDNNEAYISVDVETAGPNPGDYALLSIGACRVWEPARSFYAELQPLTMNATPQALAVCGLSLDALAETGLAPAEAMRRFDAWLAAELTEAQTPVFAAFNAPFDWMFVNDYFHRFLGRNPFGHAALDIKSFYMGLAGSLWAETSMRQLSEKYMGGQALSHNALRDAQDQALLFQALMAEAGVPGAASRTSR